MVVQLAVTADRLAGFYGLVTGKGAMEHDDKQGPPRKFDSRELFGDKKMVLIEHEGTLYRLMVTRQGKLILNK